MDDLLHLLTQACVEVFHKHTSIGLELNSRFGEAWSAIEEFMAFKEAVKVEEQLKKCFRDLELEDQICRAYMLRYGVVICW